MWAPESTELQLPVIEKIGDPDKLLARIIECIEQKDTLSLKTYILEHKLKEESIFWDLILKIGACVTSENNESNQGFFDVCNRCLLYLVKVGNPKEILLALLEQVDNFIDDVKFRCFLPLIQTTLLRIPTKLFHSLDIAMETVSAHLRSLPVPENVQLEGEEIKLFHADKIVVRLSTILESFLEFLEPFINRVDILSENFTKTSRQESLVLKKHLIRVFDHPLCYLVLTYNTEHDKAKSDSRQCAELAVKLLSRLETDFHRFIRNAKLQAKQTDSHVKNKLLDVEELDNLENESLAATNTTEEDIEDIVETWDFKMDITPLAYGCLSYLVHAENLGIDKLPFIYKHEYMLEFHLDTMSVLLKNTNYPINYKGLVLCQKLVGLVKDGARSSESLDNPGFMLVINDLIDIMIKCPVRDHRTLATHIFPMLIKKFESGGRYQIYLNILSSCSHSGLKGYLITFIKNDISETIKEMKQLSLDLKSSSLPGKESFFVGKRLYKILKLALALPEKETTDMLENSDQIISCLNMLRFIILADPKALNSTGFWDFLPQIEKDFLAPLRLGLDLSKAHYKLEQENIQQGKDSNVFGHKDTELSLSVSGMNLPEMNKKEKLELIGKALNTHYVMHSLVCRVSELMDLNK